MTSEDPLCGQNPGWTFISLQPGRKDGNPRSKLPSASPRISNGMYNPMCYPGICIMDLTDAQMLFTCQPGSRDQRPYSFLFPIPPLLEGIL